MKYSLMGAALAAGAFAALPEISLQKKDRDTSGQTAHVARGLVQRHDLQKRQGTVGTNVYDILTFSSGGAYYANITVGTPPQPQVVILDTGSSDLYFDSSSAPTCQTTGPHACKGGTFSANDSSTYAVVDPSPAFNTSFGDGSTAYGPFAKDQVCIGDTCISNVQFGVADVVNSTTGYSVGLMGLGYSENEATRHEYPNMPEVLSDAGVINSRLYSVYLNDEGAGSGTILFGGIDTSKYTGTLQTFDILPDVNTGEVDQFVTTVTALTANVGGNNNQIFSGGSPGVAAYGAHDQALPVLLDTGSSAWSVPESFYPYIIKPFTYVDNQGICSCEYASSSDSITLQFGAQLEITVAAKEFIVPIYNATTNAPVPYDNNGNNACAFMIVPSQPTGMGFQTLGDAVLRSMYVVFDLDQGQVSIAQAKVNSTSPPAIKTVAAGPSGVASAAANVKSAPSNTYSIAAQMNATASFSTSSAQSTIGTATGTAAVPNYAQAGSSSGAGGSSSSAAAAGIVIPGADYTGVYTMGVMVFMAALGMAVML